MAMTTGELIAATESLGERVPLRDTPLAFFYADEAPAGAVEPSSERTCVVDMMRRARQGQTAAVGRNNFGCGGGGYYLGFCPPRPEIAEFVSTGIPGRMDGERYKQSPELVRAYQARNAPAAAPGDYAVFKPVAALTVGERPEVIIYLGMPDELAALVGLAQFAREDEAVMTLFGSGCSNVVTQPRREAGRSQPRAVVGLFDPSARPYLDPRCLSFAAATALWEEMISNAGESFLTTATWEHLRRRIEAQPPAAI